MIRHQGASAVAAVDDQGRVALIRQFRHAAGGYIWELPAGMLDKPDEAPAACAAVSWARRPALQAERLTHLATILTTPGFSDERIHLFLAQDLREAASGASRPTRSSSEVASRAAPPRRSRWSRAARSWTRRRSAACI